MRLVVADTGPLNYLVLIGEIELLPKLFEKVFAPAAVKAELDDAGAPAEVRRWAAHLPDWLEFAQSSLFRMMPECSRSTRASAKLWRWRGNWVRTSY